MLIGSHTVIYSTNPDADRDFLRDVFELPNVDVGGGWLIFGMPPSEVAVHPSDRNDVHQFYLMCEDVEALIATLKQRNVACSRVEDEGWGLLTQITLPSGGKLGIYEPRHERPAPMGAATRAAKPKPKPKRKTKPKPKPKVARRAAKPASKRSKKGAKKPKRR